MAENLTRIHHAISPDAVYERGFVVMSEFEAVDLGEFAVKVNLMSHGADVEGIWAAIIAEEDRKIYDSKDPADKGKAFRAVLVNHALHFMPNPTWGRVVICHNDGPGRPVAEKDEQVEPFKKTNEAYVTAYRSEPYGDFNGKDWVEV